MADISKKYPEIEKYLDTTDKYDNTAAEIAHGDNRLLVVTQAGEIDGQQLLFVWNGKQFEFVGNETLLDVESIVSEAGRLRYAPSIDTAVAPCKASSAEDHKKVYDYVVSQVNKFSSKDGPDRGNLACVWVVRHLVRKALGRWITVTNSTAVFEPELRACFGRSANEADVPPGGLVISPTRRNVGHVGFLGEGKGDRRVIYSNSSKRARLEKNFTVASWYARYSDTKGLKVSFYPLPNKS